MSARNDKRLRPRGRLDGPEILHRRRVVDALEVSFAVGHLQTAGASRTGPPVKKRHFSFPVAASSAWIWSSALLPKTHRPSLTTAR